MRLDQANTIAEKLTEIVNKADSIYANGELQATYTVHNFDEVSISIEFKGGSNELVRQLVAFLNRNEIQNNYISGTNFLLITPSNARAQKLIEDFKGVVQVFNLFPLLLSQLEKMTLFKIKSYEFTARGLELQFDSYNSPAKAVSILNMLGCTVELTDRTIVKTIGRFTTDHIWAAYIQEIFRLNNGISSQKLLATFFTLIPVSIIARKAVLNAMLMRVNLALPQVVSEFADIRNDRTLSQAICRYVDSMMANQDISWTDKYKHIDALASFVKQGIDNPKTSLFFKDKHSKEFQSTFSTLRFHANDLLKKRFDALKDVNARDLNEMIKFSGILYAAQSNPLFSLNTDRFYDTLSGVGFLADLSRTTSAKTIQHYHAEVQKFIDNFNQVVPVNQVEPEPVQSINLDDFVLIESEKLIEVVQQVEPSNQAGLLPRQSIFVNVDNQSATKNENFQTMLPAFTLAIVSDISSKLSTIVVQRKKNQLGANPTNSSILQVNPTQLDVNEVIQALLLSHLTLLEGSSPTVIAHKNFIKKLEDAGIFEDNLIANFNRFLEKALSNDENDYSFQKVMNSSLRRDEFSCLKVCMDEFIIAKASAIIGSRGEPIAAQLRSSLHIAIETLKPLFSVKSPALKR